MVMQCNKIVFTGSCNIIATLSYETNLVLSCNKYSNLFKQFYWCPDSNVNYIKTKAQMFSFQSLLSEMKCKRLISSQMFLQYIYGKKAVCLRCFYIETKFVCLISCFYIKQKCFCFVSDVFVSSRHLTKTLCSFSNNYVLNKSILFCLRCFYIKIKLFCFV
jgi:hypothetical protein